MGIQGACNVPSPPPHPEEPWYLSPQEVTASCLSFPTCTAGLCSLSRVEMGAWLAEDANRVYILIPHLGPEQGSFCSPPPHHLLPQGTAIQGGILPPKVTGQTGLGAGATSLVPSHPLRLSCSSSASVPPSCPQKAAIQGDAPRCSSAGGTGAEQSTLQHRCYVSPSQAPGM